MSLQKTLEEYGLKEKHARVYLACLELGSGSILKISQKAGLPRSTTEVILVALLGKGFVSSFKKRNIKYFSTEDPKKIVASVKARAELLERALPDFRELYARSNIIPTVRFYHGKESMKIVFDEILTDKSVHELLAFSSVDDIFELLGKKFVGFVQKRVTRGMRSRVILRESPRAWERVRLGGSELREVKLISHGYEHHGLFYIWGNKIAMISLKNEWSVLIIESEELAKSQRMLFEALWDSLPTPQSHNS